MNPQDAAVGFVQPGDHDQFSATRDSIKRGRELRVDLEDRPRRAFEGLTRRIPAVAKGRSHNPDWCDVDRPRHDVMFSRCVCLGREGSR